MSRPVAPAARATPGIADAPDQGTLAAYDSVPAAAVTKGAYTWHPVRLSEEHALRAVVGGELVVAAPDGRPIRLHYERHVEHPDGNWTWVGREPGALPGTEAVITFGEKAVFGSIPNGDKPPLRLLMAAGRSWLVETDPTKLARLPHDMETDALPAPRTVARASTAFAGLVPAGAGTAMATTAGTTVDLLVGYTSGFASRLGGQSEAATRITYVVDLANQAYQNSLVDARVRLVGTRQVDYADATPNEEALYDLSGFECTAQSSGGLSCTFVGYPAALQPLHDAREETGADLVSLVRAFNNPENGGCGVAWLNGAGRQGTSAFDEINGMSVVSDSGGNQFPDDRFICSDESLAHELGHNMGAAHDRATADSDHDGLEDNEYGAFAYSFGYRTTPGSGDFFTVMAYPEDRDSPPFQVGYRVFSNPAINYCGGHPCGVANEADNARALRLTIPVVAGFRAAAEPLQTAVASDYSGDGVSDVLWRHNVTGRNAIWKSASSGTQQAVAAVTNAAWRVVGSGDFNADGWADILWRNSGSGKNVIWHGASSQDQRSVTATPDTRWTVVAVADFDGDQYSDIFWRHAGSGANVVWRRGSSGSGLAVPTVADLAWRVVGAGDFNGDGRDDVVWRNVRTGANTIWFSANSSTRKTVTTVTDVRWEIVGVGDFNGDGLSDLLWRHADTGRNTIWRTARATTQQAVTARASPAWKVEGTGDYDGDGVDDILWRNGTTGANVVWRSGRSTATKSVTAVTDLAWEIVP